MTLETQNPSVRHAIVTRLTSQCHAITLARSSIGGSHSSHVAAAPSIGAHSAPPMIESAGRAPTAGMMSRCARGAYRRARAWLRHLPDRVAVSAVQMFGEPCSFRDASLDVSPAPKQIVIDGRQLDGRWMIRQIERQSLYRRIQIEQQRPFAVVAQHALDPEERRH